ncbi:MAG: response regulator transcription factor [Nocardioidaceae bacterium]
MVTDSVIGSDLGADATERTRVLLVDDQELFRRGLMLVLSGEEDLEVQEATDGESAVRAVAVTAPDVVLLDVRMPGMSGLETCAQIKSVSPSTSIIMLTSSDEESDLLRVDQERRVGLPAQGLLDRPGGRGDQAHRVGSVTDQPGHGGQASR